MNDGMKTYRLKPGFKHSENKQSLRPGDTLRMSDERFRGLSDRFELVEDQMDDTKIPGAGESVEKVQYESVSELTIPQVIDALATMDNTADVQALKQQEEAGSNRKGVMDAVERRLMELS